MEKRSGLSMNLEICIKDAVRCRKNGLRPILFVIREPEKIEMLPQADGIYRLYHAVAGTWKSILKAFAIDPDHVKRKANRQSAQCRYTQLK